MKLVNKPFCSDELILDRKDIEQLLSGIGLVAPGLNVRFKGASAVRPRENANKKPTMSELAKQGRCPLDYYLVKYIGGGLFKCRVCGARLESNHVMGGRNSLDAKNCVKPYFKI